MVSFVDQAPPSSGCARCDVLIRRLRTIEAELRALAERPCGCGDITLACSSCAASRLLRGKR